MQAIISRELKLSMAISSAPLNTDGISDSIDAQSALQRKGPVQGIAGRQAKTEGSYVTHISAAGQAMLALDNFQANAEKISSSPAFKTPRYLITVVQGVVSSLNTMMDWLSAAANVKSRYSAASAKTLEAVNKAVNSNEGALAALKKIGVEKQKDGHFAFNPTQIAKAYSEGPDNAFSAITGFATSVSRAPGVQPLKAETPQVQAQEVGESDGRVTMDLALQQRLAQALAEAAAYTSRKAVSLYQTVESI